MEAIEFLKEYQRICRCYHSNKCSGCPLEVYGCDIEHDDAQEIVKIVEEWAREHPRKTLMQDFFEKFPNAPRTVDGLPFHCPFECGYFKNNNCPFGKNNPSDDCSKCWFRSLDIGESNDK